MPRRTAGKPFRYDMTTFSILIDPSDGHSAGGAVAGMTWAASCGRAVESAYQSTRSTAFTDNQSTALYLERHVLYSLLFSTSADCLVI
jgi:hypothetical protein